MRAGAPRFALEQTESGGDREQSFEDYESADEGHDAADEWREVGDAVEVKAQVGKHVAEGEHPEADDRFSAPATSHRIARI